MCGVFFDGRAPAPAEPSLVRYLDSFQDATARTTPVTYGGIPASIVHALGLAGEAGEYAELIKKHISHGTPLDLGKVREELGDALFYVATCARLNGLKLSDVASAHIAKSWRRFPNGFTPADSIARADALHAGIELPPVSELMSVAAPGDRCSSHFVTQSCSNGVDTRVHCVGERHHGGDHRAPGSLAPSGVHSWTDEQEAVCTGTYRDENYPDPRRCLGHYGHRGACGPVVVRSRPKPPTPLAPPTCRWGCGGPVHSKKDCPKRVRQGASR
jgi:NTP pyrophosphatase (non-canonical NTP hydrolase)